MLLIADEVMAGWGRTGKWFSVDHWNVKPDILVTAKGITSAYVPLGLCATTTKIADYFEDHYFSHGHTYEAHPLTLGPAVATIEEMQRLKLVERAAELEPYVREKLEALKASIHQSATCAASASSLRSRLVKNRKTKQPFNTMRDKVEGKPLVVDQIAAKMMAQGVSIQAWVSHFVIAPPLIVTKRSRGGMDASHDRHRRRYRRSDDRARAVAARARCRRLRTGAGAARSRRRRADRLERHARAVRARP